jgi:hypothetical protein
MKESSILQYKYVIQVTAHHALARSTIPFDRDLEQRLTKLPHFIPISVYARGDTATGFHQGIHEDTEMQYPKVTRTRLYGTYEGLVPLRKYSLDTALTCYLTCLPRDKVSPSYFNRFVQHMLKSI